MGTVYTLKMMQPNPLSPEHSLLPVKGPSYVSLIVAESVAVGYDVVELVVENELTSHAYADRAPIELMRSTPSTRTEVTIRFFLIIRLSTPIGPVPIILIGSEG